MYYIILYYIWLWKDQEAMTIHGIEIKFKKSQLNDSSKVM